MARPTTSFERIAAKRKWAVKWIRHHLDRLRQTDNPYAIQAELDVIRQIAERSYNHVRWENQQGDAP